MMRWLLFSCLMTMLCPFQILAQGSGVRGTVTSENGGPLQGASVIIRGTNNGMTTDATGRYSFTSTPSGAVLVFSAVGSQKIEIAVDGRTTLDVVLKADSTQLNEIVVTALGQRRDRNKFGSSVSMVSGKSVASSGETGVLSGLSGKASGVIITKSGGDPGAGAYIQIRGQNTINGNAQPLFIVDGIPVSNSTFNDGSAGNNSIVQQSRINDINNEDIESVQVLKGASAAALWGARAANGVIILTTKKGRDTNGKVNISFKSTLSFDGVNKMPPLQTSYGQGTAGRFLQGNRNSYGDLIAERTGGADTYITDPTAAGYQGFVTFPDGTKRYAIAPGTAANPHGGKNSRDIYDHARDVFQTGHFTDNSLSISGGNERSNFALSYSNLNQEGVVKAFSNYKRHTLRFNASSQLSNWMRVSAGAGYMSVNSSRIQEGDNVDGILLEGIRTPVDYDNQVYTGTYTNAAGQVFNDAHVSYRNPLGIDQSTIYSNPVWNIYNNKNTSAVDRIMGNVEIDLTPTDWLTITGRTGIDNYTDNRLERFGRNSALFLTGMLSKNWITEKQFNTDVFANATKTFSSNFSGSLLIGANYNSRRLATLNDRITSLIVPTAPDILTNALNSNLSASNYNQLIRTYAYYSQAELQAYNMFFLTLTGRNESASTFGKQTSSSFFFPSAALAWQFTKLAGLDRSSVLSFGKLRATWGQVGIQPQPYQNFTIFSPAVYTDPFTNGLSSASSLYGGGFFRSTTAGNDFLRPERKTESELGVDLRLLNNRISFSATVYSNNTKDVILSLPVPFATGYAVRNINAAQLSNKGLELDLNASMLPESEFRWNLFANFSMNRNKVITLAGATAYTLPNSYAGQSLIPGQPFGVFFGTDFLKDKAGKYTLDANGFPQGGVSNEIVGDPNPKWRGGLGSSLSYKGVTLSFLFDKVYGNDFYNGTRGSLYLMGTHADVGNTTVAPAGGIKEYNGNTLAAGTRFQGNIYDFGAGPVALTQSWYQGPGTSHSTASVKQFVEDGGSTRLRELTLGYTLNSSGFKRVTRLSSVDFSVSGRNVFLWTKYRGTDPEVNISGTSLARGQDWFTNPNTRSILFSIRVNY